MKSLTSARLALLVVLGGLVVSVAAIAPVTTANASKHAGCNQNKEAPDHHYDADCDGSASENGGGNSNGGGGKPCAGCVGKADNKRPPGQEPDENDSNKGYECDDNKGAGAQRGSGNPAHTGCRVKTQTTTPPPPPRKTTPPPPPSNPPSNPPNTPPDEVLPTIITDGDIEGGEGPGDEPAAKRVPRGKALPYTGASLIFVILLGGGLVAAGIAALRRRS